MWAQLARGWRTCHMRTWRCAREAPAVQGAGTHGRRSIIHDSARYKHEQCANYGHGLLTAQRYSVQGADARLDVGHVAPDDGSFRGAQVAVTEVGPRDGLQNEPQEVATATKIELIRRLAASGMSSTTNPCAVVCTMCG